MPLASQAAPDAATCSGEGCPDAATQQLVTGLQRPLPARTDYAEVRYVEMLEAPLVLRGELEYRSADTLAKRVSAPYEETTTISAGQVQIQRPGKPAKRFSLKRAPALAGLLESFSATLDGDAARLARHYRMQAERQGERWQLVLLPRDAALAKQVREVRISGQGSTPLCFEIAESSGDGSILLVDRLAATALPDPPAREALQQLCRQAP